MSRIGKKPIEIPKGVKVLVEGNKVTAEGPKGTLEKEIDPDLHISTVGEQVLLSLREPDTPSKSLVSKWGTWRQIVANMIEGVAAGYEKRLEIEGVGFRASVSGDTFSAEVGYAKPSQLKIPEGVQVSTEKNTIVVKGADKQGVAQFAAQIRSLREAEPYKGKGIRYEEEIVRRKLGKRAAAAAAGPGAQGPATGGRKT